MENNETALLLRPEQALFDVTDKSFYSFNERDSMMKFREASAVVALNRFFSLADSDTVKFVIYITEKAPHLKNVFNSFKGKTELLVKLSDEARKKLESEEWRWFFAKDGSGVLPKIRDAAGHITKDHIRVVQKTVKPELLNSLMGLTQKNNLDALTEKVIYLTGVVEQIAAGQYNDRVAMFYGARQMYIEAMSMNDIENRRIALLNAAKSADDAIAALQQTIRHDLNNLFNIKSGKLNDNNTNLIAKCFSTLNDSVQISVNVYAALGENRALLAAVTSYQCFVEQIWLSPLCKIANKTYSGCTLAEIMFSHSDKSTDWRQLPKEIVDACERIIQTERKTIEVFSEALEQKMIGAQEDGN
jgi:hypothetical protein